MHCDMWHVLKVMVPRHLKHVSESSQVCQDYYTMSRGMDAQSDPGSDLQPDTFLANTLHLQPTSKLQTHSKEPRGSLGLKPKF